MALTKVSGSILKDPLNLGEVSIGGTLTYQDVTNVDSVGVITARSGINVTGGDITIPDSIIHLEDTNTKIRFPAADTVTVETAGNEALRVDSSQRLLIGTTTEGQADADNLTVADSGSCGITIRSGTSAAGAIYFSDATSGAAEYDGAIVYNQSSQFMAVYTAQTERLRIDSSGHMGLGISPSDIDSIGKALNIASSTGGAIYLQDTDDPTVKFAAISYNGTNAGLQIHAHHSSSYIDLGTNGTERLRIASDGKVGIGTDTPNGNLQIRAGQNANFRVLADPSTSGLFVGNYGSGDGYRSLSLLGSNIRLYTITAGALSGAQERFHIASDGKVGINQTPDAAGGLVQIRYNEVYTSGTTNLLTAASKAALRIRTSSDSSKSLFFGGIDESATPYLQVGNMSSASGGATATYPLVFQPYGGNVGIGTNTFIDGNTRFEVRGKTSNTSAGGQNIHKYGSASAFHYGQYNSTGDASLNNQANGLLAFATNNTTRVEISNGGIVTKPYQPSFAVYRNQQAWNIADGGKMNFNTARHNIGNHYDLSNGRFIAPVTGSYQLNFYSILQGNYTNAYIQLKVNGNRIFGGDYHFSYDMGSVWHTVSYSQVVYLTASQYVEIFSYTGTGSGNVSWHGNNWGCFSGYLIG